MTEYELAQQKAAQKFAIISINWAVFRVVFLDLVKVLTFLLMNKRKKKLQDWIELMDSLMVTTENNL